MAEAVLRKFPDAKIAIGPPIEHGFYYDFGLSTTLREEELEEIEENMREILKGNHRLERRVIGRNEARQTFAAQPYKLELLEAIPEGEEVSLYTVDEFTDLCRGPHVASTGEINSQGFKLLRIAGAYWRGDSTRPMLTRIYGTAWEDAKQLRIYLNQLKELRSATTAGSGGSSASFILKMKTPGRSSGTRGAGLST